MSPVNVINATAYNPEHFDYFVKMSTTAPFLVVLGCGLIAIAFACFCAWAVTKIVVDPSRTSEEQRGLLETGIQSNQASHEARAKVFDISASIAQGASAFLFAEYRVMVIYMVAMSVVIVILLGVSDNRIAHYNGNKFKWIDGVFSMISFNVGCVTSIVAGYIGMRIAVYTNSRTTVTAAIGYAPAFATALKGGIVMGFGLTGLGILALLLLVVIVKAYWEGAGPSDKLPDFFSKNASASIIMQSVAPFGLGGSSIALFGRVGGGIFTKAADVGADLVGKVEKNIPEDDPRNPGVIADNVGDNVGDIAGMGSDLFGSFAEATCAAFVVSTTSLQLTSSFGYLMFPLMITSVGVITCMICSFVATHIRPPTEEEEIEPALELQLFLSTLLNSIVFVPLCLLSLPKSFYIDMIFVPTAGVQREVTWWSVCICIQMGLWSGLLIGKVTKYYTSHSDPPTREVAEACLTGAATNVIHGLALGYHSAIVPCFCIGITVFLSLYLAGAYGVAVSALGILSTMPIGLTIDAYGPISDNAGGIAEMAGMGEEVRRRTDALDAAGNTTAAVGKGFAIGSAALVSVALFSAYFTIVSSSATSAEERVVNILDPRTFLGVIVGAMLPYWFSAMTMKSVGVAAMEMVREIQRQFRDTPGLMDGAAEPDHKRCVDIATRASLKEMLPPGALVVLTPIITGLIFGPEVLSGLLPSAMASGVMMATAAANTGGAWDNAKKYIESGRMEGHGKGSEPHKAAVIGDTVGDPLKDTSGPALNILVKLMAIISVVFAPVFMRTDNSYTAGLLIDRAICDNIDVSYSFGNRESGWMVANLPMCNPNAGAGSVWDLQPTKHAPLPHIPVGPVNAPHHVPVGPVPVPVPAPHKL